MTAYSPTSTKLIQRVPGDIKLHLYNFPQQSAIPCSVDFISRLLAANPGKVKGIKDLNHPLILPEQTNR
jgi:hypothetical protein